MSYDPTDRDLEGRYGRISFIMYRSHIRAEWLYHTSTSQAATDLLAKTTIRSNASTSLCARCLPPTVICYAWMDKPKWLRVVRTCQGRVTPNCGRVILSVSHYLRDTHNIEGFPKATKFHNLFRPGHHKHVPVADNW